MNPRQSISLLLLAFLLAGSVHAQVYKCKQPDGSTEISNLPCTKGSSTVKSIPSEAVSEQTRREAERNVAQMRKEADRLEANRIADESARREASTSQPSPPPPSSGVVENCLRELERLSLDAAHRAELEARCRSGNSGEPVYVQPPVYGGPGYVRPYPPIQPRPPKPPIKPLPEPEPLPPPLNPPANKGDAIFAPPASFRQR